MSKLEDRENRRKSIIGSIIREDTPGYGRRPLRRRPRTPQGGPGNQETDQPRAALGCFKFPRPCAA